MGTHEIFYPDIIKFFDKLKNNGIDVELNIGEDMTHVYPFSDGPESKGIFRHIVEVILD